MASKAPAPVRWVARIFLVLGLAMLALGAWLAVREAAWLRAAVHTTGEIVDVRREAMTDGNGRYEGQGYRVVFRFAAADGRTVTVPSGVVSSSTSYRPGDRAAVDYHPDRPGGAALARWADRWLATTVVLGIGAAFAFFGGLFTILAARGAFAGGGRVWRATYATGPADPRRPDR